MRRAVGLLDGATHRRRDVVRGKRFLDLAQVVATDAPQRKRITPTLGRIRRQWGELWARMSSGEMRKRRADELSRD